ncbi:oxidoreductase [Hylemonella gracilis str. Niagara R]|uniref:NADPH--hemoprotein reductase n=1 Tax=Hylemonella gracilis str. Niagara R TaxID=1458275 RepID=A0A016XEZ0_9BURK|nr:sulfite reductase subunit alpha [Hylemonella gracilis]EYC50475.1 oxidoreductase [Hylemonella gracilis str. Niagara R]
MKFVQALSVLLVYGAFCGLIVWRHRQRVQAAAHRAQALMHSAVPDSSAGRSLWWVVHASQTGQAEALAEQTAQALHSAGLAVRLLPLGRLRREDLASMERLLCVVSTYGEGDAPDSAAAFVRACMEARDGDGLPELTRLKVGLLALGDASYARYCGFGRALDAWFQERGAQPLFERIEADRMAPEALSRWRVQLGALIDAGNPDAWALPDWEAPPLQAWTLRARRHMNPGSAGGPVHHLEFVPEVGDLPDWQAGDLAQIEVPGAPGEPRDYSIASVPADGALHLLVRQTRRVHADGSDSPGLASGWLTAAHDHGLPLSGRAMLRLRAHSAFRIGGNAQRPLILIGNGTGLAGLRAHIRARLIPAPYPEPTTKHPLQDAAPGSPPLWLIFGERHAATDAYYREELEAWSAQGLLRVDWVFSRESSAAHTGSRPYVQHAVRAAATEMRAWVRGDQHRPGAAIYVCGSLRGMAGEVDTALRDVLGADVLRALADEGRYRRDVY